MNSWKVVSLSPFPGIVLALLVVAIIAGVVMACWGVRREADPRRRWALWTFRILAGIALLALVLEPAYRQVQVARLKGRVVALVDRSASMRFPIAPGGPPRSQRAAELVTDLQKQFAAMSDQYSLEVFGFDGDAYPLSDALKTEPTANKTNLAGALRTVRTAQGADGRQLAGVIVLSDGADNVDFAQGFSGAAKVALQEAKIPISTVTIGQDELKDVSIENIKVDDFAFVRNSVTAEVEVRNRGYQGQSTQVVLRRDGQVVASKTVQFGEENDVVPVSFTFTPDQTGRFVYTVATPVLPEEAVPDNNTRTFALKVIRDRVRVLLVAGRPSWDERFLRGMLKQDANVELISFYILRNGQDMQTPEREMSLIPFPHTEIFREKIDTFDLILVVNYGHRDPMISLHNYRDSIRTYVNRGGALAYIGGDQSFGESRDPTPAFAEVLPVETVGKGSDAPFAVRLTPEGRRHPVTMLGTGAQTADSVWAALAPTSGANLTSLKPGAVALLEHPSLTVNGAPAPMLALWEFGRGRSLALMTDGAWRWSLTSHAQGTPNRTYERFWANAIRWLVRDPDLTAVSISTDSAVMEPGQPLSFQVVARNADFQPAADADISVELIDTDDPTKHTVKQVRASSEGTVQVDFPPPPAGAYRVVVRADKDGRPLGDAQEAVAVRAVGPEQSIATVNTELMGAIADASGGKQLSPDQLSATDIPLRQPPSVEVGRSNDHPLWDRWYWLMLVVAIVGVEWALRRRFGYV